MYSSAFKKQSFISQMGYEKWVEAASYFDCEVVWDLLQWIT